jgi:hypothetical protein
MTSPPVGHLPLRQWGLNNCPAIPYWADASGNPDLAHVGATLASLGRRTFETNAAWEGLTEQYTIAGQTKMAYEFMYGDKPPSQPPQPQPLLPLLPLGDSTQFRMPWTTYQDVYDDSKDLVAPLAATLTDRTKAEALFWPTIANFGLPYNLLVLAKFDPKRRDELAARFGDAWSAVDADALIESGQLYEIDMTIIGSLPPALGGGAVRFTPGTYTLLRQDPVHKKLTPILVEVASAYGPNYTYQSRDNAWLWALQAAKTSITVYGIWLGHVYQWHIVTAAMQMGMYNELPAGHKLWPLLSRHSQSLIDFDLVLLTVLWDRIVPPTPVDGGMSLLRLLDRFAKDRVFSDDDPPKALEKRGLRQADFTVHHPWDAYPVAGFLLDLWKATSTYVKAIVENAYDTDTEVAHDTALQAWMDASSDQERGNIGGLPPVKTRAALIGVLTSLVHRVTAHGAGSLNPSVNPVLAFVADFPPCLQSSRVPKPADTLSEAELVGMLPHTGTLGAMTTFYFTVVYGMPDVPLIPSGGINAPPYYPGPPEDPANQAWFAFRGRVHAFIDTYTADWNAELARIRGSDPGVPAYAQGLYQHWASSIET